MNVKKKKVVFVGLSGGVDSAVSAALLKQKGYEVVGVFLRTWHPPFFPCSEEDERRDAIRVAAHLDIPFLTFDFSKDYKKNVADYMINEYKAGRTPNPDIACNKEIKFGAFLKMAIKKGADFVATGHYARIAKIYNLLKGIDENKDQSYFLWTLPQRHLSKILFPIGGLTKKEVRKLAKKFMLPVSEKKDSQGICFLGKIDLKEFLKNYIKEKRGHVLLTNGKIIGHHIGTSFYTLGERHGFTIIKKGTQDKPYYIVAKDIEKNEIIVSNNRNEYMQINNESLENYKLKDTNWIIMPQQGKKYKAQTRYHGEFFDCYVNINSELKANIIFNYPIIVASGQSCVVYDDEIVIGGGIIE